MYANTSKPLVNLTLAYFRNAELGFFGVIVPTRVQTPRFSGEATVVTFFSRVFKFTSKAGDLDFLILLFRDFLISCEIVAMRPPFCNNDSGCIATKIEKRFLL